MLESHEILEKFQICKTMKNSKAKLVLSEVKKEIMIRFSIISPGPPVCLPGYDTIRFVKRIKDIIKSDKSK